MYKIVHYLHVKFNTKITDKISDMLCLVHTFVTGNNSQNTHLDSKVQLSKKLSIHEHDKKDCEILCIVSGSRPGQTLLCPQVQGRK